MGKTVAGCAGIEDRQAAADGIGGRAGFNGASEGADVNAVIGERHLFVIAVSDRDWRSGGE